MININPMNTATESTMIIRSNVRNEWVRWISEQHPTHLLDFNPNRDTPFDAIHAVCSTMHYEYDKEVAKSFNTNIRKMKRTFAVFAVERSGGRLHVHSRWQLPTETHTDVAHRMFKQKRPPLLKRLFKCKSVTATFQEIVDTERSVAYCLKEAIQNDHCEYLFFSKSFHS